MGALGKLQVTAGETCKHKVARGARSEAIHVRTSPCVQGGTGVKVSLCQVEVGMVGHPTVHEAAHHNVSRLKGARLVVHGHPHGAWLGNPALCKRLGASKKLGRPSVLSHGGVGNQASVHGRHGPHAQPLGQARKQLGAMQGTQLVDHRAALAVRHKRRFLAGNLGGLARVKQTQRLAQADTALPGKLLDAGENVASGQVVAATAPTTPCQRVIGIGKQRQRGVHATRAARIQVAERAARHAAAVVLLKGDALLTQGTADTTEPRAVGGKHADVDRVGALLDKPSDPGRNTRDLLIGAGIDAPRHTLDGMGGSGDIVGPRRLDLAPALSKAKRERTKVAARGELGGGSGRSGRRRCKLNRDNFGVALAELRHTGRVRERVGALALECLIGKGPQRCGLEQVKQNLACAIQAVVVVDHDVAHAAGTRHLGVGAQAMHGKVRDLAVEDRVVGTQVTVERVEHSLLARVDDEARHVVVGKLGQALAEEAEHALEATRRHTRGAHVLEQKRLLKVAQHMGAAADDGAGLRHAEKRELEVACRADAYILRGFAQLTCHVTGSRGRGGNNENLACRHAGLKKVARVGADQRGLAGVGDAAHKHASGVGRRDGASRFRGAGTGASRINSHVGHLFSARRAGRNG